MNTGIVLTAITCKGMPAESTSPTMYEIKLQGHLGQQWTEWFDGATIALQETGETVLTYSVVDQAALHGLLRKVRDLGLPLLSVNRVEPQPANKPNVKQ